MWMWETLMRVFNLRNMSSMMRFLFLKIILQLLPVLVKLRLCRTLIKGCKHVAVVGRASKLMRCWQVIKICAGREWGETPDTADNGDGTRATRGTRETWEPTCSRVLAWASPWHVHQRRISQWDYESLVWKLFTDNTNWLFLSETNPY